MRTSVIVAAALLLLAAASCSWMGHVMQIAESVRAFIGTIDEQSVMLCEAGWLPPKVCDYWDELRIKALERWSEYKAKVIDYLIRLLTGALTVPSAERPAVMVTIDHEAIYAAAQRAADEGYLTVRELAAIEEALPRPR